MAKSVVHALKTLVFFVVSAVIVNFMIGLRSTAGAFGQFLLAMWAMAMAIETLAGATAIVEPAHNFHYTYLVIRWVLRETGEHSEVASMTKMGFLHMVRIYLYGGR